ncbi:MAG: family 10 glycosylhydrolase [Candidatus Omnitrophota bacterium]
MIRLFSVLAISVVFMGCAHAPCHRAASVTGKPVSVPILLYHHIARLPDGASRSQQRWTLSPEKFDKQMQWLASQGFHPVTMEQLIAHLKHGLPLPAKPIVLSFDDGWKDQYYAALPILKRYNFSATFFIITDSVGHSAYMNWQQLREMSASGMDIQPHSSSHQKLPLLPRELALKEIIDSKKALESHLNKPALVFAYPFGTYSREVISMAKAAGFEGAVTVNGLNGGYIFRNDESYTLPRYAVEGDDKLKNIARACGSSKPAPANLFVSLLQDPPVLSSRKEINKLIHFARQAGVNTLFVQVYRQNKAWFPSEIADSSSYKECLKSMSEDPFALLIRKAHRQGIQVHAWVNLLSLAENQDAAFLKKYGPDILTRNLKSKEKLTDYLIDEQYFLEPGDPRVREDLLKIVGEILRAYPDLDGIQFDYIRYPDMEPHYGYTENNIKRFKKTTGFKVINEDGQDWKDWKRGQVTELLAALVKTARSIRPGIQVSATGCMPYSRAYYEAYQDWPSWISRGLVDFVTVMNYSPEPDEFKRWIALAKEKTPDLSKLKIGIGAYKLVKAPEIFNREFQDVEESGGSCVIFHYGSLVENPGLKKILFKKRPSYN